MITRLPWFAALIAASAIGRAQTAPEQAGASAVEQRIERIQDGLLPPVLIKGEAPKTVKLATRMAAMHVPGVSIAVIHNGAIEWARGFGVAKIDGAPVTADTLFQAASISKPVTALAVLHLVEAGKLDLDTDVNRYLKSWKLPENEFTAQAKVTLRELLSHSAGMTVHGFAGYAAGEPVPTLVQVLDGAAPANNDAIRVDTVPGKAWRYSGGGYVLIQQILADLTGRPFPELMQETVLGPIGMIHSTYEEPLPSTRLAEAATPYRRSGQPVPGGPHTYPEMAPAGLWTTPSDLARYLIEVQKSLQGKANHVLSAAMTREMLTPGLNKQGLGLATGGSAEQPWIGHNGANEGFQCEMVAYNDGDGAVVMTNSDSGGGLAHQIIVAIAYQYGWPDFRPPERTIIAVDPKTFDSFVGLYELGPAGVCTITREGDRLFTQISGQPKLRLFPMGTREFFLRPVDARVTFAPDREGAAPEMTIHQNGRNIRLKRLTDAEAKAAAEAKAKMEAPGPAPGWVLKDLSGNPVNSDQLKGKIVVVDFWATWCAGCVSEMPGYVKLQDKYAKDGVVIVGISMDEKLDEAKEFVQKHGINYQIVMANNKVARAFGVSALPATFIIDRSGTIMDRKAGVVVATDDFEKALLKVINPVARTP